MSSKFLVSAIGFVIVGLVPVSSSAQSSDLGVRAYAAMGSTFLAADTTFEAVGGGTRPMSVGGGIQLVNLWKGLFTDVALSQMRIRGERVFVDGGTVYPLGIPLSVTLRPIDIVAGWRVGGGRASSYVGAGISHVRYAEIADFAQAGDDVNDRRTGTLLMWGVDVTAVHWLHIGGEMRYRIVEGVIGHGGASAALGDSQLGGLATSLRISVGS